MIDPILRPGAVREKLGGISTATLHRIRHTDSTFPAPIQLSPGLVGWRESQIAAWLEQREAGDLSQRTVAATAARKAATEARRARVAA